MATQTMIPTQAMNRYGIWYKTLTCIWNVTVKLLPEFGMATQTMIPTHAMNRMVPIITAMILVSHKRLCSLGLGLGLGTGLGVGGGRGLDPYGEL